MAALCKKWWQRSDRSWWARRRNSQSLDRRSILPNILHLRFCFANLFTFDIRFCQTFYILDLLLPKILDSPTCALLYSRSTVTLDCRSNIIATQSKFGQKVGFAKRFVVNSVRMHHRQRQRRQLVAFTLWIVTLVPIPNLKAAKHHIFQLFYISIFLKYWNLPGKKS